VAAYASPDPAGPRTTPGMHEPYWYPLHEPGPNWLASLNDLYRLTIAVGIAIPPETETAC
jgi:hypothetical protein